MSSTYSTNLTLELVGTGEQAGNWGATNNLNLGTLLEQAISGYVTQAVSTGTDTTITIPNGASGVARNMFIELTGTGGASTNLIVPANKKLYFIYNNTASGQVTVKVTGLTGISVPNGAKTVLVSNGTDIVVAENYMASLTLGSALPVLSGGTGGTTSTGSGAVVLATSPTLVTPALGTPSSVNLTNATSVPVNQATGILPVVNGGTGLATLTANNVVLGNGTSTPTFVAPGTTGNVLTSNGTTWASTSALTGIRAQVFTSNGTFTIPANVTTLKVTVVGGGAAGGGVGNPAGGGAGGAAISYLTGLTSGNTLAVTVGAGGTISGTFNGSASTVASGTQTISTITGGGGYAQVVQLTGGLGGTASGGTINTNGGQGEYSHGNNGSCGGASIFGGSGTSGSYGTVTNGGNGTNGGGGGVGSGGGTDGNGGTGIVVFEW